MSAAPAKGARKAPVERSVAKKAAKTPSRRPASAPPPAPAAAAEGALTEENKGEAFAHLAASCPKMALALEEVGPPDLRKRPEGYGALLQILVDQQVSVAAGRAIWARLEAAGVTEPEAVLARDEEALRALGLSRPKARYARAAAEAVLAGDLCFSRQRSAPLEEAVAELTAIKGVGLWTASIYQMFCVGRADLFPVADVALQEAARRLYGLEERPAPAALAVMAEPWAPWRSAAALLLWRYYAASRQREGIR